MAAPPGGRGKQLRAAPEPESEEESSEESSSEEEEEEVVQNIPSPARGGGKQLRPMGKQLRAPSPQPQKEEESDSSTSVYQSAPAQPVVRRGMGKQLARQPAPAEEEEDSDSSSDEEPWAAPPQRGQGKQLRPPPAVADKEESDMEESSEEEEEEEEEAKKEEPEPPKPKQPQPAAKKPEPEPEPEAEEPEAEESEESEFEPDPPKRGRGRPPARAAATRATRSAKVAAKKEISSEEEEEEEGEESDDDEEDSSSDEEQEWDMETFDTQKLVEGKDDKKYLDSLPELERENVLAERFDKLKSEADMKKALRENKRKEKEQKKAGQKKKPTKKRKSAPSKAKKATPAKKKKAAKKQVESESEEEEDEEEEEEAPDTSADVALAQSLAGKRVSARNLVKKGKQFKKQAALAKIRENRANKQTTVEASDSDLDYGNDTDDSDDDYEESTMLKPWQQKGKKPSQLDEPSDDESMDLDDDHQMPMGSSQRRSEDIEAGLEEYIKVSIPRRRLMRWCNEPFFEKAVRNFYVRLGIGRDNKSQKACYRLCRITGIVTKNEYSFPPVENKKAVTTDKWLKVSFGKFVREFKMITVSDHRPSADDVTQLVSQLRTERLTDSILTKKSANKLRKRQDELVNNYTYTKEDIEMLVKEKKKRSKKSMNIGVEKTRTAISAQAAKDEVEEAKKRLEDAKVERMEADEDVSAIAESNVTKAKEALEMANEKLEEKVKEQQSIQKEDRDRANRLKKNSKVQNWAKVNQRAKMANQNADFQAYIEQQAQAKIGEPKFDPYARRRQKPKNLWEVGVPKQSSEKVSDVAGASGTIEEEKKESSPSERDDSNAGKDGEKENRREVIPDPQKLEAPGQANQFAFDDDIMISGDIANLGGIGAKKVRTRARKGLSLEEYQEKKTAGTL